MSASEELRTLNEATKRQMTYENLKASEDLLELVGKMLRLQPFIAAVIEAAENAARRNPNDSDYPTNLALEALNAKLGER